MSVISMFSVADFEQVLSRLPHDAGDVADLWRAQCRNVQAALLGLNERKGFLDKDSRFTREGVRDQLRLDAEKAVLPAIAKVSASLVVIGRQRAAVFERISYPEPDPARAVVRSDIRGVLREMGLADRIAAVLKAGRDGGDLADAVAEVPAFLFGLPDDVVEKFRAEREMQALLAHPEAARQLGRLDEGEGVLTAVKVGALMVLRDFGAIDSAVAKAAIDAAGPAATLLPSSPAADSLGSTSSPQPSA